MRSALHEACAGWRSGKRILRWHVWRQHGGITAAAAVPSALAARAHVRLPWGGAQRSRRERRPRRHSKSAAELAQALAAKCARRSRVGSTNTFPLTAAPLGRAAARIGARALPPTKCVSVRAACARQPQQRARGEFSCVCGSPRAAAISLRGARCRRCQPLPLLRRAPRLLPPRARARVTTPQLRRRPRRAAAGGRATTRLRPACACASRGFAARALHRRTRMAQPRTARPAHRGAALTYVTRSRGG
jgi:hypothetical protein